MIKHIFSKHLGAAILVLVVIAALAVVISSTTKASTVELEPPVLIGAFQE